MTNFQPGKAARERMIVERLLHKSTTNFSLDCIHLALSVIHETVLQYNS